MKTRTVFAFAVFGWAAVAPIVSCRQGIPMSADTIFIDGKIFTMDPARPWAEAVAVREGILVAVGTTAEIRRFGGPKTRVHDLRGGFVSPGFIDSHVHFINGGFALLNIQLRQAKTRDDFTARIAAKAREIPKGEWILNGDWDHQQFNPVELPRRDWIDAVTPDTPVCVNRLDGHMVLCNTPALRAAGITRTTPIPPGGEIVKDPVTGDPTGILKDAAMDLVYRVIPGPAAAQTRRAAEAALRYAAEKGVTSVHDVSGEAGFDLYQEMLASGRLTVRIYFYVPVSTVDAVRGMKLRGGFGNDVLRFAGMKGFADGSLGSATAAFFEPYTDEPGKTGLLHGDMFPPEIMDKRILEADAAGLQTAVHAIGDRAISIILDIYEKTSARNPARDRRFRIEHAQHVRPADFSRFARLGIVVSAQPYHAIDDGRWAETKIGSERARTTYPFRTFLDQGIRLAFGSDWPVAPMDPIMGIYAAVTRATLDGRHPQGWVPEQKITAEEALRAFTLGGAYAEFAEDRKGSLVPGKLADLVVLDRDPLAIPAAEISGLNVVMTVCGGRIVFQR